MPLVEVLSDMEMTGVRISPEDLKVFSEVLTKNLLELEDEIYALAGMQFNISSPLQLGKVLFEQLKISDAPLKTKTKQFSTQEEFLQKLTDKHPIVGKILTYRGLKKLLNTYSDSLPKLINPLTGKIHTSFNQAITSTGRLSSTDPNLQNIPIREAMGREIRKAFIPSDEEHVFLSADYSQVELRLMAHMSGDEQMIAAFLRNEDIHTATAAKIFGVPPEEVTREMRGKAKTANFGIIYGISAFGLSQRLNIPRSESQALIEGYFRVFPGVRLYMSNIVEQAKQKGYVETLFGRRRYLPDIRSSNANVRGMAERNAINAPIQGTAADMIKKAMIDIYRGFNEAGLRSKMILQVHDELVFDVYRPELEQIKILVKEGMEKVCSLKVPLIVEIGTGDNWLDAH
jgi:DNA polymerase-1